MSFDDCAKNHILLICTVGGSHEPLVASIKQWSPARILFLPSKETALQIKEKILPLATLEGNEIGPGCYETYPVPDAQDFHSCVHHIQELTEAVQKWVSRGDNYKVVVDFTGGTKCMTAALSLQAHRWPCLFSYVGGTERTKDGVGIVVSGKENIVHYENPWDSLGYLAVEDALPLFDRGSYAAAAKGLQAALLRVSDPTVKRQLVTLSKLAEAYAAWDRFDHRKARDLLGEVEKSANDLLAMFSRHRFMDLVDRIKKQREHLAALTDAQGPSPELIRDLIANARRRAEEGRYDDAVARIYRAIEALAQLRLRTEHGVQDTGKVPLQSVPGSLQDQFTVRASNGTVKLGLQDCYAMLGVLGDPMGRRFSGLRWDDPEHSPLAVRNQSILAHGFQPVGPDVFSKLWQGCLELAGVKQEELLSLPKLGRVE